MHASMSFLYTVIERTRAYLDEPATNAKYDNEWIIRHLIYPCMTDVLARLNLNQDNPICIRHQIALQINQEHYQLPPNVQEIWRFTVMDTSGYIIKDSYPRGIFNPMGPGWSIEGNVLSLRPFPTAAESAHIWYVPTGDVLCHYGTGSLNGTTFTLASTPTLGLLDRRPNAYAGSILRLLPTSGPVQERVIASHDVAAGTVTTRLPFYSGAAESSSGSEPLLVGSSSSQSSGTSSGAPGSGESNSSGGFSQTFLYEIAPIASQPLYEAISLACACKLGAIRGIKMEKMQYLEREYKKSMKTIKDNLANLQMRSPKAFDKNTVDSPLNKNTVDNPLNAIFFGGVRW